MEVLGVKSFLILEDDHNLRDLYEDLIRKRYDNVHIDQVANGVVALEYAKTVDYTVIIVDLSVPLLNGAKFYEKLKKEMPTLAERTVFISGNIYAPEHEFIFQDSRPYLSKPFKSEDFYTILSHTILREEEKFIDNHSKKCKRESIRFKAEMKCILEPNMADADISHRINCKTSDYSLGGISVIYEGESIPSQREFLVSIDKFKITSRTAKLVWTNTTKNLLQLGLQWA
jgi:DNA-binding NarL/FixJ family response regulator